MYIRHQCWEGGVASETKYAGTANGARNFQISPFFLLRQNSCSISTRPQQNFSLSGTAASCFSTELSNFVVAEETLISDHDLHSCSSFLSARESACSPITSFFRSIDGCLLQKSKARKVVVYKPDDLLDSNIFQ